LRAVLFLAVLLRAAAFLRGAAFLRAVLFFAVLLRAAAFLRGAAFFFEDDERFFAELFELRPELREPERDEDRVVAGMADTASVLSELGASTDDGVVRCDARRAGVGRVVHCAGPAPILLGHR